MSEDSLHSGNEKLRRALEAARERHGEPHPRDILKRQYDEAQTRPRNEALEKWGPVFEEQIMRHLDVSRRTRTPQKDGIEIDRE